jgi:hypothetical protein
MANQVRGGWRRAINKYVGLLAAMAGMALVLSSFLFLDNLLGWYITVIVGLLIVLAGFLYGAYPFMTSERRFHALRIEVDQFIGLVRRLNTAAFESQDAEFHRIKAEMMASVERMSELAGKSDEVPD